MSLVLAVPDNLGSGCCAMHYPDAFHVRNSILHISNQHRQAAAPASLTTAHNKQADRLCDDEKHEMPVHALQCHA